MTGQEADLGIFGAGWVGLVTGVLRGPGPQVVIRDVVPERVER